MINGANFVATFAPVIFAIFAILVARLVRWNDDSHHIREVTIMGRHVAITNGGLALTLAGIATIVGVITLSLSNHL